jgi:maltooligosyltrehalose trehalohydrolase
MSSIDATERSLGVYQGGSLFVGARPLPEGTYFRVWAPIAKTVEVVLDGGARRIPLVRELDGYHSALVGNAFAGDRYKLSIDGGEAFPDPASRYQPEGPHGSCEIVDPTAYTWSTAESSWRGLSIEGQVFYELHIGTFTPEGTFLSAIAEFPRLKHLGITALECMPLAEFAGDVGWGYDGVQLFAPFHHYGQPDHLRRMIDAAHGHGLGVILDVVYNHLGPDGNYLTKYSEDYFSRKHTEWGDAINFDGENSLPVRHFFLANATHWISEYHFDGLRLDATQAIHDDGSHGTHILAELVTTVREAAGARKAIIVAENEPQDSRLLHLPQQSGYGLDAVWNDDFHHSAVVALTGRREAYFSDHLGRPQEFISAAKYGYLYQGQYYAWQNQPRGTPTLDLSPKAFITFLENHDQVANFGCSLHMRLLSSPARYRAMTALWLLCPGTPMFFQGQEYGAETPFYYFAGHDGDLGRAVSEGRKEFMMQFANQDTSEMKACFEDPEDRSTYLRSRLDPAEQGRHPEIVRLHTDLLALRRSDATLRQPVRLDGAVLANNCFLLRYLTPTQEDRLILVNLGAGVDIPHLPEPLAASPLGHMWKLHWSSESPAYGGCGSSAPDRFGPWQVTGECTQFLVPVPATSFPKPDPPKTGVSEK